MPNNKHLTVDLLQDFATGFAAANDARFAQKATTIAGYNISDAYTKTQVDDAIAAAAASAYKAKGTIAASGLVSGLLTAANEGNVYNLTAALTISAGNKALFVENAEGTFPAGSNVVIVEATPADNTDPQNPVAATYKFDVLPGFVDLSDYATLADVETASAEDIAAIVAGLYQSA